MSFHFARPEEMGSVDLADVDVLVLGSAYYEKGNALDQWLPRVRRAVGEGLGLFTVGGRQSYDSGRWGLSALQDVVPLALETEEEALDGQVSFLAILDKSGSMAFDAGDRPRMAWANAATLGAIRQLRDTDRAGVLAVDDTLHWIQKMRTVETHSAFSAVKDIRGGKGGILVYSALKEAQKALKVESSPVRHVVLFADAQDAEEKVKGQLFGWGPGPSALDVAKDMAEEGITLSVVAIGDPRDQDVAFLELLASVGKGRFHLTSNAQDLVGLFTQETQRLVTKRALEGNVQVKYAETAPYLEGVDMDDVPPLQRVELVQTRATVQPFWQTKTGEPVLASWRFGLGRVTSFTGPPDSVASWKNWENAPLFWKQLMRWAGQPELELREELSLQRTQAGDVVVTRPMPKTAAVPQYTVSGGAQRWMRPVAAGRWSQRITSPRHGHTEAQKLQVAFGEQPGIERWLPGWYPQEFGIPETLPRPPKGSPQAIGAHVNSLWPIWTGLLWFLIPFSVWSQRVRSL